jgi:hypothetical protein
VLEAAPLQLHRWLALGTRVRRVRLWNQRR